MPVVNPPQEWQMPWNAPSMPGMSDKQFLRVAQDRPLLASAPWSVYGPWWQREYARRFLLRPAEAQPNTQDGAGLLRAIG